MNNKNGIDKFLLSTCHRRIWTVMDILFLLSGWIDGLCAGFEKARKTWKESLLAWTLTRDTYYVQRHWELIRIAKSDDRTGILCL